MASGTPDKKGGGGPMSWGGRRWEGGKHMRRSDALDGHHIPTSIDARVHYTHGVVVAGQQQLLNAAS